MTRQVIMDWTESQVEMGGSRTRDVRYRVYKEGEEVFQEITDPAGVALYRLALPDGLALEKSSYEVMLRYALVEAEAEGFTATAVNY